MAVRSTFGFIPGVAMLRSVDAISSMEAIVTPVLHGFVIDAPNTKAIAPVPSSFTQWRRFPPMRLGLVWFSMPLADHSLAGSTTPS
jgi:hypothetical protein